MVDTLTVVVTSVPGMILVEAFAGSLTAQKPVTDLPFRHDTSHPLYVCRAQYPDAGLNPSGEHRNR